MAIKILRAKGPYFWLNSILVAIATFFTLPLFGHVSTLPFIYNYSFNYLGFLIAYTVPIILFSWAILTLDRSINRKLFFASGFIIFALEISVRILFADGSGGQNKFRKPVPYRMHSGLPNATYKIDSPGAHDEETIEDTLNALGFRGKLPPKNKMGEYRIIILGGSTVLNRQSTVEKSMAGKLEKHFRDDGFHQVKVYNWGVIAYVSGQELSLMLNEVTDYQPDLVIVYDGANDVQHRWSYDPRPGYPYNFLVYEEGMARMNNNIDVGDVIWGTLHSSKLLSLVFKRSLVFQILDYQRLREQVAYQTVEWEKAIVASYINNINKMCSVAHGFGFKIAVFLQPVVQFKAPLSEEEIMVSGNEPFQGFVRRLYDGISEEILVLKKRHEADSECGYYDFHEILSNRPEKIFKDYVHVTDSGRAIIVDQIYSELIDFLGSDLASVRSQGAKVPTVH